jgi:hypothetical protein
MKRSSTFEMPKHCARRRRKVSLVADGSAPQSLQAWYSYTPENKIIVGQ